MIFEPKIQIWMKNGKNFWKNRKKFGNNFSLISSIDRLDNGVIF
jgi:hypothetical protein